MYRIPVVSLRLVREKSNPYAGKQVAGSRATYYIDDLYMDGIATSRHRLNTHKD